MSEAQPPNPPQERPLAWNDQLELQALARRLLKHQDPQDNEDLPDVYEKTPDAWIERKIIPDLCDLIEVFLEEARVGSDVEKFDAGRAAGESKPVDTSYLVLRMRYCKIEEYNCERLSIACGLVAVGCEFSGRANFTDTEFNKRAIFRESKFSSKADFSGAVFTGRSSFYRAEFHDYARFDCAKFASGASFKEATFSGEASFYKAEFSDYAHFDCAKFSGVAFFSQAQFFRDGLFDRVTFSDMADFRAANFGRVAAFTHASFRAQAQFNWARFGILTKFEKATFSSDASFMSTNLGSHASFFEATFCGDVHGDLRRAIVRSARFGRDRTGAEKAKDFFNWVRIRRLGERDILTRVSYAALIVAPVLAGVWPAVRAGVNAAREAWEPGAGSALDKPYFPLSLALAFFAAVAVTVARAIYESLAPEALQADDERGFIERKVARFESLRAAGKDGAAANDALRDSTEKIAAIARTRPDRHANFVSRFGESVWIPPRDRIEWFEEPEVVNSGPSTEPLTPRPPLPGGEGEAAPFTPRPPLAGGEGEEKRPTKGEERRPPRVGDPGIMSGAERARVAIEEGARAEYLMLGEEKPSAAWASGLLYTVAVLMILAIFLIQLWRVALESSAWAWGFLGLSVMILVSALVWRFGLIRRVAFLLRLEKSNTGTKSKTKDDSDV